MEKQIKKRARISAALRSFIGDQASCGILLMGVAVLAIVVANSPLESGYRQIVHAEIGGLSLLDWINDALMALFFLLVGLEIKRETISGQLSSWSHRILPGFSALGGMIVPALIFVAINRGGDLRGWAIPSATDIAFSLGVLSLLGSRVPLSLKVFLTALAIIDDLGAVIIIALFYSHGLNLTALTGAAALFAMLLGLNLRGVVKLFVYLPLGIILWICVFNSGIHATIAGVLLAMVIPMRNSEGTTAPLVTLERALQPWVLLLILPIFAFANAGLSMANVVSSELADPVPLGVAAGLFFGKQIGVFLFAYIAIKLGFAARPANASWVQLYGVAILCGIGFTMSLFMGLLAYSSSPTLQEEAKLGVLVGSLLSALYGIFVLRLARQ